MIIKWRSDASRYFRYNIEVLALALQFDNTIDECYNDELSKKALIQIRR